MTDIKAAAARIVNCKDGTLGWIGDDIEAVARFALSVLGDKGAEERAREGVGTAFFGRVDADYDQDLVICQRSGRIVADIAAAITAAEARVRDECARIAEAQVMDAPFEEHPRAWHNSACQTIAAAIRSKP